MAVEVGGADQEVKMEKPQVVHSLLPYLVWHDLYVSI